MEKLFWQDLLQATAQGFRVLPSHDVTMLNLGVQGHRVRGWKTRGSEGLGLCLALSHVPCAFVLLVRTQVHVPRVTAGRLGDHCPVYPRRVNGVGEQVASRTWGDGPLQTPGTGYLFTQHALCFLSRPRARHWRPTVNRTDEVLASWDPRSRGGGDRKRINNTNVCSDVS